MVPIITDDERRENLQKSLEARRERQEVRQRLKTGQMSIKEVFERVDGGDRSIGRMRVETLIRSVPGYGLPSAQKLMRKLKIDYRRRIKGLGKCQRNALVHELGGDVR